MQIQAQSRKSEFRPFIDIISKVDNLGRIHLVHIHCVSIFTHTIVADYESKHVRLITAVDRAGLSHRLPAYVEDDRLRPWSFFCRSDATDIYTMLLCNSIFHYRTKRSSTTMLSDCVLSKFNEFFSVSSRQGHFPKPWSRSRLPLAFFLNGINDVLILFGEKNERERIFPRMYRFSLSDASNLRQETVKRYVFVEKLTTSENWESGAISGRNSAIRIHWRN